MNFKVYEQQKFENNTFIKIKLQLLALTFPLLFIVNSDLVQYSISSHINPENVSDEKTLFATHAHTHTYIHIHTHTRTHIHTHTHTAI